LNSVFHNFSFLGVVVGICGGFIFIFLESGAIFKISKRKRGRGGNSLPLPPLSFPPRPSGLGLCETPQAFRSKKVRAFSIIAHQTGFCKFLEADNKTCSPRLVAWLARNEAVKSNSGTKSQDAIFSEMRRFVKTKFCMKIFEKMNVQKIFISNFSPSIPPLAELRRFSNPSPNIIINPRQNI